jgi:hypothetical protein
MKLYLVLVVRRWSNLSTDSKMVELISPKLGMGFCSIFESKEEAMLQTGCSEDEVMEVETQEV